MSSKTFVAFASLTVVIAAAFAAGAFVARDAAPLGLPRAAAMTALSDESFAVCTTSIDGNFDGFFILDFQTGDLTGGVLGSHYADIFAFVVLIIVLTLRPSGLLGERVADRA